MVFALKDPTLHLRQTDIQAGRQADMHLRHLAQQEPGSQARQV